MPPASRFRVDFPATMSPSSAERLRFAAWISGKREVSTFASATSNEVAFRCLGGVRFTSGSGVGTHTVAWTPGSGSWTFTSDERVKDLRAPVDGGDVLARLASLLYQRVLDPAQLEPALALPLVPSWRKLIERRLQQGAIEDWGKRIDGPASE